MKQKILMCVLIVLLFVCGSIYGIVVSNYDNNGVSHNLLTKPERSITLAHTKVKKVENTKIIFEDKLPNNLPGQIDNYTLDSRYYMTSNFIEGKPYDLVKEIKKDKRGDRVIEYIFILKDKGMINHE